MEFVYWVYFKIYIFLVIVIVELVFLGEKWFCVWDVFFCICFDRERIVMLCYVYLKKFVIGFDIFRLFWGDLKNVNGNVGIFMRGEEFFFDYF